LKPKNHSSFSGRLPVSWEATAVPQGDHEYETTGRIDLIASNLKEWFLKCLFGHTVA
jgi:hypothetical protein